MTLNMDEIKSFINGFLLFIFNIEMYFITKFNFCTFDALRERL